MTQCLDIFDINNLYLKQRINQGSHHTRTDDEDNQDYFQRIINDKSTLSIQQQIQQPKTIGSAKNRPGSAKVTISKVQKPISRRSSQGQQIQGLTRDTRQSFQSQTSFRSNTSASKTTYVDVAYNDVLNKQKRRKNNLKKQRSNSTSSLDSSFEVMEKRLSNRHTRAEMIDQKYMINGYMQLVKDHKQIHTAFQQIIRKFVHILNPALKSPNQDIDEQLIFNLDQFFKDNEEELQHLVGQFFALETSLDRLIRMNITEPYYNRVQNKRALVQKHKPLYIMMDVYLKAYGFMAREAYQFFMNEGRKFLRQDFQYKVKEIILSLESTQDKADGQIVTTIFRMKIEKISEWHQLINQIKDFITEFENKYYTDQSRPIYKVMKSKKIYTYIHEQDHNVQQFLIKNYSLPDVYTRSLEDLQQKFKQMKEQAVKWNVQCKQQPIYAELQQVITFQKKIRKINEELTQYLDVRYIVIKFMEQGEDNEELAIDATDKVTRMQLAKLKIKPVLKRFHQSKEIKKDQYVQKVFNKCMLQIQYFDELKDQIEQI